MKELIDDLILKDRRTKGELIEFLGLSNGGFYAKMKNGTWKKKDLELISEFFSVPIETFIGEGDSKSEKEDQYLQEYLRRIEKEWKSVIEEKNKTIEVQQRMLTLMEQQLTVALGKEWHSEDELPVLPVNSKKIKPLVPAVYAKAG